MKNEEIFSEWMELLAEELDLCHDGSDDVRLFDDREPIRVYAECMDEEEYSRMEKDLNSFEVKGPGFMAYAWNDISGYEYWKDNEGNYIQVTVVIIDPYIVDVEEIRKALSEASSLQDWDNTNEYLNYINDQRGGTNDN